jgi:hypothetical protein
MERKFIDGQKVRITPPDDPNHGETGRAYHFDTDEAGKTLWRVVMDDGGPDCYLNSDELEAAE